MANPLAVLRPAVYTALTSPPVLLNGAPLPVVAFTPPTTGTAYVLLDPAQDTFNLAGTARACRTWECTLLADVVTLHATAAVSVARADAGAEAVSARLDNALLPLPAGWQVIRAVVESGNGGNDFSGEVVDVHRYLRLRYTLQFTYQTPF